MIRVLIAEDSPTARLLLREMLAADPELQIVGEAVNGIEAVEMTIKLRPDVVTMDVQMPGQDGLEATASIMAEVPTPIVIISGHLDAREVENTMRALQAGALTLLPKPVGPTSPDFAAESERIVRTVKAMSSVKVVRRWSKTPRLRMRDTERTDGRRRRAVGIAVSTGGPQALQTILPALPPEFPAPILVVQHIAAGFVPGLVTWLQANTQLVVKVAQASEPLRPGHVYIAPDEHHLGVTAQETVLLSTDPKIGQFRPSGTYLFRSLAAVYGGEHISVILTGMGSDGLDGLQVRRAGALILAQDEASSIVYSMPKAAAQAGLADEILHLDMIAATLVRRIKG